MSPKEIERKIISIENMVSDIHAMMMTAGVRQDEINWPLFESVMDEFVKGNGKPLDRYIKRGGRIPSAEEQQAYWRG